MTTWTALTTLEGKDRAEALGEAMEEMEPAPTGVGVFEIEDDSGLWEVGAYFTDEPDAAQLALLEAGFGVKPFVVSEVPETDWVAHVRRELHPVEAGRFFVHGSHDADKVPPGKHALLIEAAMAFGTGHHGTTLGCLRAFDRLLDQGLTPGRVADVGCGTAVLAMAAARVWPESLPGVEIVAGDIDPVAVDVAEANMSANGLAGRVACVEAAGFGNPAMAGTFDLVFANILMGPLIEMAPEVDAHLAEGGHAILSGIMNPQADEVVAVYARHGINLAHREEIGDWTCLTLRKPTG